MPGYGVEPTIFQSGTPFEKFRCPICDLLLRDAVQPSCGHWLCQTCAEELFASESPPRCPRKDCGDNLTPEEGVNYFPDRFVQREILSLDVVCQYMTKGCNWKGKFSDLEAHLRTCIYSFIVCNHCHQDFAASKNGNAQMVTGQLPVSESVQDKQECCLQRIEVEEGSSPDYENDMVELDGKLRVLSSALPKKLPSVGNSPLQPVDMNDSLRQRDEEIATLRTSKAALEKLLYAKSTEIDDRDFRLSLIENSNRDGSIIWKIPQFSQRMNDAQSGKYTSMFSLPFYTGRYSYKMCLRLYILGDGIGKNSHMSLFFVIMRGEFDNILQWPFTHKVTFKLVNQTGARDVIVTFQPDPMSSSFRKPKSDMNVAIGCPCFVAHRELKNRGFIVDDTIFIKCIIDRTTIRNP